MMNGFRKSKGIVIELTALLDVILIMLFWMMMSLSQNNEDVVTKAQQQVADAQSQAEIDKQNAQAQIDSILDDTSRQLAEAQQKAENTDSLAAQNQQALDGYEQGMLVTLSLKYEQQGDVLYISQNDEEVFSQSVSDTDMAQSIISSLQKLGLNEEDTVLCALVYDGDTVLYKDVNAVNAAVSQVHENYSNFYCTYINTTNLKERFLKNEYRKRC